jgi:hypothetical protein
MAKCYPPVDCAGVLPMEEFEGTFALVSVAVSAGVPVWEFDGSEQLVRAPTPLVSAATLTSVTIACRIRMSTA